MAKIGFLGLGMMGSAMASRLLDAGNEVTVWNRTAKKAQQLVESRGFTGGVAGRGRARSRSRDHDARGPGGARPSTRR